MYFFGVTQVLRLLPKQSSCEEDRAGPAKGGRTQIREPCRIGAACSQGKDRQRDLGNKCLL